MISPLKAQGHASYFYASEDGKLPGDTGQQLSVQTAHEKL